MKYRHKTARGLSILEMKADNQLEIRDEMRLGLVPSFQGTYATVGAYM